MQPRGKIRQRRRELFTFLAGLAGAAAVAAAVWGAHHLATRPRPNPLEGRRFECVLDFGHFKLAGDILYAGLSYEMLKDFASENSCEVRIRAFTSRESSLDSLRSGAADIVVLPKFDSALHVSHIDSVAKSHPVCKELCWVMRRGERAELRRVNSWIDDYTSREEFGEMLERFRLMPSSHRPHKAFSERRQLSPYDSTIRIWADSIGWDWRMLAAVIYTESKFAINVTSPAGAKGLMQIMPLTARVYGVQDVLDPEENIRAGASYLGHLDRLFRKYADGEERLKYVFASYNAGETRVLRYLNGTSGEELSDSALRAEIDSAAVDGLRAEIGPAAVDGLRAGIDSAATDGLRAGIDPTATDGLRAGIDSAATDGLRAEIDSAATDGLRAEIDSANLTRPAQEGDHPVNSDIDSSVTAYIDKIFENYRNFCRICEK